MKYNRSMKNKKKYITVIISFFILIPFLLSGASLGGISLEPAFDGTERNWFIYQLAGGESRRDFLIIRNTSQESKRLKLLALDSRKSPSASFELKDPEETQEGIGAWVQLDESEIFLESQQEHRVGFTITVPEDAEVGQQAGALVAETVYAKESEKDKSPFVNTRVGVRVYNTVPGEIVYDVKITSVKFQSNIQGGPYGIVVDIKNDSNTAVRVLAKLQVDGWGWPAPPFILQKEMQISRKQTLQTEWNIGRPLFGRFVYTPSVVYEGTKGNLEESKANTLVKIFIPYRSLTLIAAILLFFVFSISLFARWRRKRFITKGWKPYRVDAGDNIITLAQSSNISWEILAKINHIKKPYALTPGKVILLPPRAVFDQKGSKEPNVAQRFLSPQRFIGVFLKGLVVFLALFVIFVALSISSIYIQPNDYNVSTDPNREKKSPATLIPQVAKTPVALPSADESNENKQEVLPPLAPKETIAISVLNGSGVSGHAARTVEKLQEKGFVEVSAGNAENFDYKNLTIIYKPGFQPYAEEIQEILSDDYVQVEAKQGESYEADIVVIVGR